jgi:hypothetical protein
LRRRGLEAGRVFAFSAVRACDDREMPHPRIRSVVCGGVALASLIALAGPAAADEAADAAKKVLNAQATALAVKGGSLEATFTDDALLFTPDGVLVGHEEIDEQLWASFGDAEKGVDGCKVKSVKVGTFDADAAWITADLAMHVSGEDEDGKPLKFKPWTMRVTELVVRDGDAWHVRAAHLSRAVSDKAGAGTMAIPGAVNDSEHAALLASPAELASKLATDKATTVIGSSAKEKAIGAAKAKKLLAKWKSLSFTVVDGVRWTAGTGWAYAAANVEAKSGKSLLAYRVLVLLRADGDDWQVVSVHYSNPVGE